MYQIVICHYINNVLVLPLYYFKIAIFKNGFGALVFTVHHLIADSWSLGLFAKAILQEYHAVKNNTVLPDTAPSYIDYIETEKEYLGSKKFEKNPCWHRNQR